MYTAKKFLHKTDYDKIAAIIRTDPIRLRKEFLGVAVDPAEDYCHRLITFRILNGYAQMFGVFTPLEKRSLTMGFQTEFPAKRLQQVTESIHAGEHICERWLVFWYCIAVARITMDNSSEIVQATREVYKGNSLGSTLEIHMSKIDRLKYNATHAAQMEAG
ncbi:MAG TPA: hypothetical protein VGO67_07320 [Verrucomicrobiae bacterium]|jgi:hypothetical protein